MPRSMRENSRDFHSGARQIHPVSWFRVLYVFVVLSHASRRIVHFAVTEHPTQEWTIQQLREAFPWKDLGTSSDGAMARA